MDAQTIRTYLSYGNEETIEKLRQMIRTFTNEEIEKLKTNKLKMIIHLVGNPNQRYEDIQSFQELADNENIPMKYNYKTEAVTLGEIPR